MGLFHMYRTLIFRLLQVWHPVLDLGCDRRESPDPVGAGPAEVAGDAQGRGDLDSVLVVVAASVAISAAPVAVPEAADWKRWETAEGLCDMGRRRN